MKHFCSRTPVTLTTISTKIDTHYKWGLKEMIVYKLLNNELRHFWKYNVEAVSDIFFFDTSEIQTIKLNEDRY